MTHPLTAWRRPAPSPWRGPLRAGDAVRALALLSVVVGTWHGGAVATALFLLVLGGTTVPRAIDAPRALDVAYCSALLLSAWAAQLDWYASVAWLDVVAHAVVTALIAVLAARALQVWGVVGPPRSGSERGVLVVGLGAVLAVLWELGEWAGNTFLDRSIQVGYGDTVGDLAAALVGCTVTALVVARRA
ncbi:hypothetical protein [uncultured Cellulomonas sp.]|uniref:hypothetical protein n=1 Tax=uncultured Cellulomonas sp. TaxID=189682 RepID=UPI0028E48302|nr:hypothetical protein [uncultured Cellulomonas sp.]